MSELDKAIEMCKVIVECPCSVSDNEVKAIDTVLSTIEQLRDKVNNKLDKATLTDFFISSVDETQKPIWTEEHISELLNNFDVISKGE